MTRILVLRAHPDIREHPNIHPNFCLGVSPANLNEPKGVRPVNVSLTSEGGAGGVVDRELGAQA